LGEQAEVLLRIPEEHRDIIEFMMETGLRPGEACALMAIDIDHLRKRALIRRTYSEARLRNKTKQKKEQWIPLSDRASELVKANENDSGFVFRNPATAEGYKYKFVLRVWNTFSGTSLDLYEGTRHSFCTQIIEDGTSKNIAQRLMRHTDGRSTDRYFHPTDDKARDIVNRRGGRKIIEIKERRK
jgi:integrase